MINHVKRPTIREIKELICGLQCYRTYFGCVPDHLLQPGAKWARPQDLIVEYDKDRVGPTVEYATERRAGGEHRKIRFRLAENWFESVYSDGLAVVPKRGLVIGLQPTRPPCGMDRAARLLLAEQTRYNFLMSVYFQYCVWFDGDRKTGYPLKHVVASLQKKYVDALGIEKGEG